MNQQWYQSPRLEFQNVVCSCHCLKKSLLIECFLILFVLKYSSKIASQANQTGRDKIFLLRVMNWLKSITQLYYIKNCKIN